MIKPIQIHLLKISKNYGKTVENGTYEYLTVVGKTNEEIAALSKNKGYTVLENTANLQAIEAGNYVMMNTWNNDQEIAGLYAYDSMSVISEKIDNGVYRLTLANPLQNNASVSIEFDKGILEVVAADPEISVDQNIITLNSAGLNGSSRSITVKTTPEVTKEALEKLIQEQKEHQEKDYTASSWKVYSEALKQAQTVVDQATATQAEVDQAEAKLRSAVKQLVKVPTKEVDKTNLLKIIKENEKHQEKDYTASSWKAYSEALKQAQTVADQTTATQAEVDQAEAELRLAVKQLTLKNSGENKKEQKNGGNNGHLNTSTGVDQTGTKQVKPSSQGGFRKASQFLPSTGEKKSIALVIIGLLVIASGCLLVFRKSKSKK